MKHSIILANTRNSGCSRQVIVDGITYKSVNQMRFALGLSESVISKYKKQGLSYEEAIDRALVHKEEREAKRQEKWLRSEAIHRKQEERKRAKQVSYNGITYNNLKEACNEITDLYGIYITPNYVKDKAMVSGKPINIVFAEVVTFKRRKLLEARKVLKRSYGRFFNMYMKDVYRLMDYYVEFGGFVSVDDKGYREYLAKEVGVTKAQAEHFIKDYKEWVSLMQFKSKILSDFIPKYASKVKK